MDHYFKITYTYISDGLLGQIVVHANVQTLSVVLDYKKVENHCVRLFVQYTAMIRYSSTGKNKHVIYLSTQWATICYDAITIIILCCTVHVVYVIYRTIYL